MVTLKIDYEITPYSSSLGLHFDGWVSDTPDNVDERVAALNALSDGFVYNVSASEHVEHIDVSGLVGNGEPSEDDNRRFTLISADGANRLGLYGPVPSGVGTQPALVDKHGNSIVFTNVIYG